MQNGVWYCLTTNLMYLDHCSQITSLQCHSFSMSPSKNSFSKIAISAFARINSAVSWTQWDRCEHQYYKMKNLTKQHTTAPYNLPDDQLILHMIFFCNFKKLFTSFYKNITWS